MIAVRVVEAFLTQRRGAAEECCTGGPVRPEMEVIFCCFSERDKRAYALLQRLTTWEPPMSELAR